MQGVSTAAEAMLGRETDELIIKALVILADQREDTLTPLGPVYGRVLEACLGSNKWRSVAAILMGTVAHAPNMAHLLLEIVSLGFSDGGGYCKEASKPEHQRPTSGFAAGALLGFFQAGVWLDTNWKVTTPYEEAFPIKFPDMVLSNSPAMQLVSWAETEYEQELSQAIKAWVRPEDNGVFGHKARRLKQYQDLIQELSRRMKARKLPPDDDRSQLQKLEVLVLDQLAYAQFGAISPMGRIMAMSSFFQSHDRFLRETTPHASPARQA